MHFIRKQVKNLNTELYKNIMERYIDYTQKFNFSSSFLMSDLLRHSLCNVLDLESIASCKAVEGYVDECSSVLREVIPVTYLNNSSKVQKEALLEACIHCIEMSIKKAEV